MDKPNRATIGRYDDTRTVMIEPVIYRGKPRYIISTSIRRGNEITKTSTPTLSPVAIGMIYEILHDVMGREFFIEDLKRQAREEGLYKKTT